MQTFAIGLHHTQGDPLGYVLVAPSGRALNACAYFLIQLTKNLNSKDVCTII